MAKGKSPYKKYGKKPYKYVFPNCSHAPANQQVQSYRLQDRQGIEVTAKVNVCTVCNTTRGRAFQVRSFVPQRILDEKRRWFPSELMSVE